MKKEVFRPANILLPTEDILPELWSVIACDQFTSERDYWERIKREIGESPSTLNMIIPEAYLEDIDEESKIKKIAEFMEEYINQGKLREIKDSFIYVEREQSDGKVRKGLVGVVDLEEYDFSGSKTGDGSLSCCEGVRLRCVPCLTPAAILASEGTVLDRLPSRIRVRKAASLELPHIMTFIADVDETVIEPLAKKADALPLLYDFELMEGGGHLKGMQVSGNDAENIMTALNALHEKNKMQNPPQCLMIMGDGNHSLAAAKSYWDEIKQNLSASEQESHPARYALLEVNNLYDPAISFEAIHRVVFDVSVEKFVSAFSNALTKTIDGDNEYSLQVISSDNSDKTGKTGDGSLSYSSAARLRCVPCLVKASSTSELITKVQEFLDDYIDKKGGKIDYIHDEDVVRKLAKEKNCVGILLPTVSKPEFFKTVSANGVFPRKSFSVGHARDKRYYMECRKII